MDDAVMTLLGFCILTPERMDSPARIISGGELSLSAHVQGIWPGSEQWLDWFVDVESALCRAKQLQHLNPLVCEIWITEYQARQLADLGGERWSAAFSLVGSKCISKSLNDFLGYEVVGLDELYYFHSWRCYYSLESLPVHGRVHLAENGLFEELFCAISCAHAIEVDRESVEPWLVLGYKEYRE